MLGFCLLFVADVDVASATPECFDMDSVRPFEPGDTWVYLQDGSTETTVTVLPGTRVIGGVETTRVRIVGADESGSDYLSVDAKGWQIHRSESDGSDGSRFTYDPAILKARPQMCVGDRIDQSGEGEAKLEDWDTFDMEYEWTTSLTGTATLAVPAGEFDALVFESSQKVAWYVPLFGWFQITARRTDHWAAEVGLVRSFVQRKDHTRTWELVEYAVPESGPGTGLASALLTLLAICGLKRRRRTQRATPRQPAGRSSCSTRAESRSRRG